MCVHDCFDLPVDHEQGSIKAQSSLVELANDLLDHAPHSIRDCTRRILGLDQDKDVVIPPITPAGVISASRIHEAIGFVLINSAVPLRRPLGLPA